MRWMHDKDVMQFLEARFFDYTLDDLRKYAANFENDPQNILFGIFLNEDNRHIGNVKLGSINKIHGTADIGIMIGDKTCWGKGYAAAAIRLVTKHAFGALDLRKVTAGAYSTNIASIAAFKRVGFVEEGRRKEQICYQGVYVDHVLLGCLRNTWFKAV